MSAWNTQAVKNQGKEFDAADRLAKAMKRINQTAIVDDDYPEVRHGYESALRSLYEAMKANGRFDEQGKMK